MSDFEPPPSELKDLFAAEKAAPTVGTSVRAGLRSRITATVGRAPLGHAAAGTALGGAGKALAIIAITLAASGGVVIAVDQARSSGAVVEPPTTAPTNVAVAHATNPRPEAKAPAELTSEQPLRVPIQPRAQAAVLTARGAKSVAPAVPAPSEPELLKRAWTALSAGKPEQALQITDQDAQLHPDGVLAEEREAARIAALARLHRIDEARSAASHFVQEYPASVHRALVERAIQNEETP